MSGGPGHWDAAYRAKGETKLSWFQETPSRSLALIERAASDRHAPILDVGGGASRLVDLLIARGYRDLSVLDISSVALDTAKVRLGADAAKVEWIAADITQWRPTRRWQIWHDRAMFHFLTEEDAQQAYIAALDRATEPGATVIIAGFAPTGPERCSGLPVWRHDGDDMAKRLGGNYVPADTARETHRTPLGASQDFLYLTFRRLS